MNAVTKTDAKRSQRLKAKLLALAPFFSFLALGLYVLVLKFLGDPRVYEEGAPQSQIEASVLHWYEVLWLGLTLCGVIFVWLRCLYRSFRARRYGWFVLLWFVWPAAPFYVWKRE